MEICPRCNRPLNGAQYCLYCRALVSQESGTDENAAAADEEVPAKEVKDPEDYPAVSAAKQRLLISEIIPAALAALSIFIIVIGEAVNGSGAFFVLVPVLSIIIAVLVFRSFFFKNRRTYKQIRSAYADYGDIEEIYKQVNATALYADAYLTTDGKYIISQSIHHSIVRMDDVRWVYKFVYKRNMATVSKGLIIVNRHNEKVYFPCDDESAMKAILFIKKLCPGADVGYSPGNRWNNWFNRLSIPRW